MKKKLLFGAIIVLIPCVIFFVYCFNLFYYHYLIVTAKPDPTNWNLTNDKYTVCPIIDDDSVTFSVNNKEGEVVFYPNEGWRARDFKSINIDENSIITIISGDTGASVYVENGNDSFKKLDYEFYDYEDGTVSFKETVAHQGTVL